MALYIDQILVYSNGRNRKITASDSLQITGDFTAANLAGAGASITSLNASNLSSGTVDDARLSSNVALYDAAAPNFTGTITAVGFSGDGSALTDLDADELTSGTVNDARLSANVPLLNATSNAFSGDMSIGGDLTVTGAIISTTTENVLIGDAFIDLLANNASSASVQAGGFTVTAQAIAPSAVGTDFVAGVAGVSNPYITMSADPTSTFAAGDIISVSGSTDSKNDGQYVVLSVSASPNRITIKGIGTTGTSVQTPFAHNQFVAQTGEVAGVFRVRVAVIASSSGSMNGPGAVAVPAGTFCWAYGATESAFVDGWTSLAAVSASLQSAYNGGPSITLTNGNDLVVSKPTSGTAAISLEANAASDITVDGADLDISADHVNVTGPVVLANAAGVAATTTGLAAGDIAYVNSSGVAALSDNATNTSVDGVVIDAGNLATVYGSKVVVKYTGGAPSVGATLYLSSTAGQGTATLPASGDVFELGRVVVGGVGGVCTVIWKPVYVATL